MMLCSSIVDLLAETNFVSLFIVHNILHGKFSLEIIPLVHKFQLKNYRKNMKRGKAVMTFMETLNLPIVLFCFCFFDLFNWYLSYRQLTK